jgi:hypothetical protein
MSGLLTKDLQRSYLATKPRCTLLCTRRFNPEDDLGGFELITSCKRLIDAVGITEDVLAGKTVVSS